MAALNQKSPLPVPDLPPAYSLVTRREAADAFDEARRLAGQGAGAGTFVRVGRADVLEFAVVLEPDEPLRSARRAVFAGMAAIADALASFGPPEKPVTFTWPATVHFDGGRLGGGRLGWPETCAEDQVPDWLVFSGMLLAARVGVDDPGAYPQVTWLDEEGFDPAENDALVGSFARHLLVAFDLWAERGFDPVADSYLARLPTGHAGERRGIDRNGDLLIHRGHVVERVPLLGPLQQAGWFDPTTGLPRYVA